MSIINTMSPRRHHALLLAMRRLNAHRLMRIAVSAQQSDDSATKVLTLVLRRAVAQSSPPMNPVAPVSRIVTREILPQL